MGKNKILISLFILCIISLFSGCTSVRSYVISFHKLPPIGVGKTFDIVPFEHQKGSIEFSTYEERVSKKIEEHGYKRVRNSSTIPNYLVFINYGIDDGTTTSGIMLIFGQTGGGCSYNTGTIHTSYGSYGTYSGSTYTQPTYGQIGSIPYAVTKYKRYLNMTIIDSRKSNKDDIIKVYEGRVLSRGSSVEISVVLPTMIEALFKDFPGQSGKTKKITMGKVKE